MAHSITPLVRRVRQALVQEFPPPDTIKLEDCDGVIGVITSKRFAPLEMIDRQNLIHNLLAKSLSPDEQRRIQIIVGVSPDEGTGYLESAPDSIPQKHAGRRRRPA
jgi:hypothetical protein